MSLADWLRPWLGLWLGRLVGSGRRIGRTTVPPPTIAPTTPVPTGPAASAVPAAAGRLVLVVEDEGALRKLTERVLVRAGWVVLATDCGESALELLPRPDAEQAVPLTVVISDVVMPGMDGLELIRAVRRVWPGLSAILVSGYAEANITRALAAENIAFLAKPYTTGQLVALVARTVERDAAERNSMGERSTASQTGPAGRETESS
jgi:DNA-binding NtrC family response regulator